MKISIIIPTFNRAHYICDSIDSVISQNYGNHSYEILVIDDGSTDNTSEVLKKYKNKIKYIKLPHSGKPAVARNHGISIAEGELIAFQDSDDIWTSNKMEVQLREFDENTVMTYGQALIMDENGILSDKQLLDQAILGYGTSFKKLIKTNVISTLTVVARRDAIISAGGFNDSCELRAVEDYELWLKILAKFPNKIKAINTPLAYYRKHENNISITDEKIALGRIILALESIWDLKDLSSSCRSRLEKQLETFYVDYSRISPIKKTPPLISVIMPVYNGSAFLKEAIESILSQTYNNFELIIIDDGSKDSSYKIIKQFKDDRIRILRQANHGLPYSLNKGISLSRGQYIARQDQDDISMPSRLEKELQLLISRPSVGAVSTFFTYFDENTFEPGETITQPYKSTDIRRSMLLHNPIGHGTVMFKRSVFDKAGPYSDELGPIEDFQLWLKILDVCDFAIVPENLYLYRLNSNGMSSKGSEKQKKETHTLTEMKWKKQFPYKNKQQIIKDGYYYRNSSSIFAEQLFIQYINQNIELAKRCFQKGYFRWGYEITSALKKIDNNSYHYLKNDMLRSLLKKVLKI